MDFKTLVGLQIGNYELTHYLGQGGFGAVFEAHHRLLGVKRAIKFLVRQFTIAAELGIAEPEKFDWRGVDDDFINEAQKEAQHLADLKHANILTVHDLNVVIPPAPPTRRLVYITMDYAEGGTLAEQLKTGPLPLADVERLMAQVCAALNYAHARKRLHLDLKPANILLDAEGNALVSDFGLAQVMADDKSYITATHAAGTMAYSPPEQLFGAGKLTPASDVFALGATLFHLLTGAPPDKTSTGSIEIKTTLPPGVKPIVEKATRPNPADRYQSAGELAAALTAAMRPKIAVPAGTVAGVTFNLTIASPKDRQTAIAKYLKQVEVDLKAGKATEHTYRGALQTLLETYAGNLNIINEPKRVACGAPDLVVMVDAGKSQFTLGYVETKDIGKNLDAAEKTDQLKRYLPALDNLILTDYLEFRWYVNGELRQKATPVIKGKGGKLKRSKDGLEKLDALLVNFLSQTPQPIATPDDLARQMARLTHLIRQVIIQVFNTGEASEQLKDIRRVFSKVLIPDLDEPQNTPVFADMYAQTLAYGLFAARCNHTAATLFKRSEAAAEIPKTNPFLRDLFTSITGPKLNDEPFASFVNDLVQVLAHADMDAILEHFSRRTGSDDPIIHFYETFLIAYDPALREQRGVYYTPAPVVDYIVRSVDALLKNKFHLSDGLANTEAISYQAPAEPGFPAPAPYNGPKTLILDPAAGTGTFLYHVVDHIRQKFRVSGNAGMWDDYVKNALLPRLYGFELLMAPYAVAHLKMGLQLAAQDLDPAYRADWAYKFSGNERLNIFLSNTLEEADCAIPSFHGYLRAVTKEAKAAARVKQDLPIMVILGNPPYSGHSANRSQEPVTISKGEYYISGWKFDKKTNRAVPKKSRAAKELRNKLQPTFIGTLIRDYFFVDGKPLGERNPKWLQDDYVKFIRWAQWRIERTGSGVLALITNHGYLDNPTFRGMRQSLLNTFTDIYILNLHGNSKKRETAPDGGKDENVFDIQQGVAIGIFIKEAGQKAPAAVHHADLWGTRQTKYDALSVDDMTTTNWQTLNPQAPAYFFIPRDTSLENEYQTGWKVTDIFRTILLGPNSHRDGFAIAFDMDTAQSRLDDLRNSEYTDLQLREKYNIKDTRDWKLKKSRSHIPDDIKPVRCLYRPFDFRFMLYGRYAFDYPRPEINDHLLEPNIALISTRQTKEPFSVLTTDLPVGQHKLVTPYDGSYVSPLYLYPPPAETDGQKEMRITDWEVADDEREPNLNPAFVRELQNKLGLTCNPPLKPPKGESPSALPDDAALTFSPEDVLHYIYAVFHSPAYRDRYAEFLKVDFPRVPVTSNVKLFRKLAQLGQKLASLHLLEAPELKSLFALPPYPVKGDNAVAKGYPKYNEAMRQVSLNKTQYFERVSPEVWEFKVGGYQVCHKWLKDRRGRQLRGDEIRTYRKIIVALEKTIELMAEIDNAIGDYPVK